MVRRGKHFAQVGRLWISGAHGHGHGHSAWRPTITLSVDLSTLLLVSSLFISLSSMLISRFHKIRVPLIDYTPCAKKKTFSQAV